MPNSSFTRKDLVVVAISLLMFGCLLFPALGQSESDTQQSLCANNLKQLAIAMMNHSDTRKSLPLASTQPIDHKPGSESAESAAGFSWLANLMPFMEQQKIGDVVFAARKAGKPASAPDLTVAATAVKELLCPSFKGGPHVVVSDSDYKPLTDGSLPAISNYQCFAGSFFFNTTGLGRLMPPEKLAQGGFGYEGDGALPFPGLIGGKVQKRGLSFQQITDGASNTFAIAETIEPAYSAWVDGQSTWLIAAWPGNPTVPTIQASAANPKLQVIGWNDEDKKTNKVTVNLRKPDGSPIVYLQQGRWSGSKERRYAAASNHSAGANHAYLDAHVGVISADVDPNVYLHLVTRNGRDPISDEFRKQQAAKKIPALSPGDIDPTSGASAVQVVTNQWNSTIDWSPLALGDLRLSFPQILSADDFRHDPSDRSLQIYEGKSTVFQTVVYDKSESTFTFYVNDKNSGIAVSKLFKQLRQALGDPTSKTRNTAAWKKHEKWPKGWASFEFVLTEPTADTPTHVKIRVISAEK